MRLHSYVVRYDSGFAPNPFFGICTLATCKPDIRRAANRGDWIIGSGSANRTINRGGRLVYAMRVMETLTFQQYWSDPRFEQKKPNFHRSRMHACGDNIYSSMPNGAWSQLKSFHSKIDGSPNVQHIQRDTGTNRVLISKAFVYYGGQGPRIPQPLRSCGGLDLCVNGRGRKVFDDSGRDDARLIARFTNWIESKCLDGYTGEPTDWVLLS